MSEYKYQIIDPAKGESSFLGFGNTARYIHAEDNKPAVKKFEKYLKPGQKITGNPDFCESSGPDELIVRLSILQLWRIAPGENPDTEELRYVASIIPVH